jgi:hypothetical protein
MRDFGDEQVKGMDRFIPTRWSAVLLVALITAPPSLFAFLVQTHDFVLGDLSEASRLPTITSVTLGLALVIAVALCVELAVALNHSKHRKIKHVSNEHSQMSFKWLASNASIRHYLFLAAIFTLGAALGHYF